VPNEKSQPKGIDLAHAVASAKQFLKNAHLPPPKGTAQSLMQGPFEKGQLSFWVLTYPGEYRFTIERESGLVCQFDNDAHKGKQAAVKRDSPMKYKDALSIKRHLASLANELGLPKEAELYRLRFWKENSPDRPESKGAGCAKAYYMVKHYGYPTLTGGDCMVLWVDPRDGVLDSLYQSRGNMKIESHTVKLTMEEARSKADNVAKEFRVGIDRRTGRKMAAATAKSELKFVMPNGEYGGVLYKPQIPFRMRLAWVMVCPGNYSIWIDAEDGRVLGGMYLRD
jgi:hypothetical protein